MTTLSWIVLTLVSLLFSALFSGVEIAYITGDRLLVEIEGKKGSLTARIVGSFYRGRDHFISTLLVGNNIALVIYGMGAAYFLEGWLHDLHLPEAWVLLLSTLASTLVILLAGEFLPKTIFRINANAALRLTALPVWVMWVLLYPIAWFTSFLSRTLMRLSGIERGSMPLTAISLEDVNEYLERDLDDVSAARRQDEDVESEVKMFHNALDFTQTRLRDCMVPRNEVVAVSLEDTDRSELSQLFTATGRSKILVYRDDIDTIEGYIHVSELFHPDVDWRERIKPVLFAPEALQARTMMERLLKEKRSLAVVVDEFGGTAGIVTLEDLVEEIFGDIRDEHDTEAPGVTQVAPGVYDFPGRIEVRDLRDTYHLDIPEDDTYQTLAGYILAATGSLPEEGEVITLENLRYTIMRRTATRLEVIRVEETPHTDEKN